MSSSGLPFEIFLSGTSKVGFLPNRSIPYDSSEAHFREAMNLCANYETGSKSDELSRAFCISSSLVEKEVDGTIYVGQTLSPFLVLKNLSPKQLKVHIRLYVQNDGTKKKLLFPEPEEDSEEDAYHTMSLSPNSTSAIPFNYYVDRTGSHKFICGIRQEGTSSGFLSYKISDLSSVFPFMIKCKWMESFNNEYSLSISITNLLEKTMLVEALSLMLNEGVSHELLKADPKNKEEFPVNILNPETTVRFSYRIIDHRDLENRSRIIGNLQIVSRTDFGTSITFKIQDLKFGSIKNEPEIVSIDLVSQEFVDSCIPFIVLKVRILNKSNIHIFGESFLEVTIPPSSQLFMPSKVLEIPRIKPNSDFCTDLKVYPLLRGTFEKIGISLYTRDPNNSNKSTLVKKLMPSVNF